MKLSENMERWILWEFVFFLTMMFLRDGQAKVDLFFREMGKKIRDELTK